MSLSQRYSNLLSVIGICLLLAFLPSHFADAQNRPNDRFHLHTLEVKLGKINGQKRIDILNQLSVGYLNISAVKSLKFAHEALQLAITFDNKKGKAKAILGHAAANLEMFKYDEALAHALKALAFSEQIAFKEVMAESQKICGIIYSKTGKQRNAVLFFSKCKNLYIEVNPTKLYEPLILIGDAYMKENALRTARENYLQALQLAKQDTATERYIYSLNALGKTYALQQNFSKALDYHKRARDISIENGIDKQEINSMFFIGEAYQNLGDTKKAIKVQKEALLKADQLNYIEVLALGYKSIASTYLKARKYREAYDYQRLYSRLNDTIWNQQRRAKITELSFLYETDKREKKIQELKFSNEKQGLLIANREKEKNIYYLIVGFSILFTSIFLYLFLQKKKANKELTEKNHKIVEQKEELEQLIEKLGDSEEKFRKLIETVNAAVLITSKGKILYVNRHAEKMTGYDRSELSEMFIGDIVHADSKTIMRQTFHNPTEKRNHHFEVLIKAKNGNHVWVDLSSGVTEYENKTVQFITAYDITENKVIDEKLRKSELMYRTLIQTSPDGVMVLTLKGVITFVSDRVAEMFQIERKNSLIGNHLAEYLVETDRQIITEFLTTLLAKRIANVVELRKTQKVGSNLFLEVNAELITDSDGEATGFFLNCRDITDRKKMEQALKENRYRFQQLANATFEGIIIHDNGEIIETNDKILEMTGYLSDELAKLSIFDLIDSSLYKTARENLMSATPTISEVIHKQKNGNIFYAEILSKPFIFNGKDVRVAAIRDITERKKAEQKLKVSQSNLAALINNTEDFIWSVDADFRIITLNAAMRASFEQFFGTEYSPEDNHLNLLPQNVVTQWKDDYLRAINGDQFIKESHYLEKNGILEVGFNPIIGEDGEITGAAIFSRDITAKKLADKALQNSEERLRLITNNVEDLIARILPSGEIIYASPSWKKIVGYEPEELISKAIFDFVHPDERAAIIIKTIVAMRAKSSSKEEYRIRRKNGDYFWMESHRSPIVNDNNKVDSIVLVGRDITERKNADKALQESEQQLRLSNITKDKMLSIIGHDLRGALGGFTMMLNLLINNPNSFDEKRLSDVFLMLKQSSDSTLELLENLMLWAKNQRNLVEFSLSVLNLENKVNDCVYAYKQIAKSKKIELKVNISQDIDISADENMFLTIVRNLVTNAIKFSLAGGLVSISAKVIVDFVEISIADSGIGISEFNQKKIFYAEKKFSSQGTNMEKGSGLGLILCKDFVEKHGGKIWVESEEGNGSIFRFTIPYGNEKT